MQKPEVRQLAVPLLEIEAVADVELVRHDESDVAHREIVDKPPVRPVEQRHGGDRGGAAEIERAYEVVERQAGVDDVLDDQDVAVSDVEVEVLEEADLLVSAHPRAAVAGELDEVDRVQDRHGAREVGGEDETRLERRHEDGLATCEVTRDLGAELPDAHGKLRPREVDLADPVVCRPVTGVS